MLCRSIPGAGAVLTTHRTSAPRARVRYWGCGLPHKSYSSCTKKSQIYQVVALPSKPFHFHYLDHFVFSTHCYLCNSDVDLSFIIIKAICFCKHTSTLKEL
jgi:hypothetical protein